MQTKTKPEDDRQGPIISLVLPTFNRVQLLTKALDSIAVAATNTAADLEVIVVDNGSTDKTATVVREAAGAFPCKLHYVNEECQGSSRARNRGLEAARGYYIVFMDDDQIMDRNYLKNITGAFEETGAVCVGGVVTYYNAQNLPHWLKGLSRTIGQTDFGDQARVLDDKTHKGLMGGNIAFIKSELMAAGAFNERLGRNANDLRTGGDLEIQDRMRNRGKLVAYHPELIQYHYFRPERYKKNYWRRYYYDHGRSVYVQTSFESGRRKRSRFPIPPWLLRSLLTKDMPAYLASLFSFDSYKIFRSELEIWTRIGQIAEALKLRKETTLSSGTT